MALHNDVDPPRRGVAALSDVTMHPAGGGNFLRWDLTHQNDLSDEDFTAAKAGWGLVNGWPHRQTIAEKTLQKLRQQIGPNLGYLPGLDDIQFEVDEDDYPISMLPLRLLVGQITPEYSYSFRKKAGVWAVQQDATHNEPGIKLLAYLVDGRQVELPCSDWSQLTKMVCFDDDFHDHIHEPNNANELLMQVQYCFLMAAASQVHGFQGKDLPIHRILAAILQTLTHRIAVHEQPGAEESFVNGQLTDLLAENFTLRAK